MTWTDPCLLFFDIGTTFGSELIQCRPSGVDAYFSFLFSTTDPCSELLFGRLGQLLSFFSQWRPYALSCFFSAVLGDLCTLFINIASCSELISVGRREQCLSYSSIS